MPLARGQSLHFGHRRIRYVQLNGDSVLLHMQIRAVARRCGYADTKSSVVIFRIV
jgi:hypothetical protein